MERKVEGEGWGEGEGWKGKEGILVTYISGSSQVQSNLQTKDTLGTGFDVRCPESRSVRLSEVAYVLAL